ncbi:MAG TPA: lysozyme inhibitor LprI family protein [Gemmatimonadaceae bacterium]|nr:lysozyme inhibitor LprI family protein [Gemmatimonadaceae bacterium]
MSTDRPEFTPDLSKLDNRYQILTELNRAGDTRAYLARHLELNRDVTIQVVRLPEGADEASAEQLASDAHILASSRHPHIVPVLEELPLGDGTHAVVRPRVRGTTLEQLISTVGTIPNLRVADTLEQVSGALDWARLQGVVHRHVSPSGVVFQQGSGKVLLAFEPAPTLGTTLPSACDDARTLGELAWRMLAGQRAAAARLSSLATVRPELSRTVIKEVDALIQCDRTGEAVGIAPLISALDPGRVVALTPAARAAEAAPSGTVVAATAPAVVAAAPAVSRSYATPVGSSDRDAVIVVHTGLSFGTRLAMAVGIAAVIVAVALLLLNHRRGPAGRTAAGVTTPDTGSMATGDVSLRRPDGPATNYDTTAIRRVAPGAVVPTTAMPGTTTVIPGRTGMIAPPGTRRSEPPVPYPPFLPRNSADSARRADSVRADSARPTRDTARSQSTGDVCDSPASADQRACLASAIRDNDVALNETYRRVVVALRRQANVSDDAPDPPAVEQLRRTEQSWLDWRDSACRGVGGAPLYARARAQCFAQESARRARVLQQKLDSLPPR